MVDSGTISGTVVAVDLGGSSGNRLELLPGYALRRQRRRQKATANALEVEVRSVTVSLPLLMIKLPAAAKGADVKKATGRRGESP